MYDYLSTVSADYTAVTMSVTPTGVVKERVRKNQTINTFDDGSEERISFATAFVFYIVLALSRMSESDAGTVFDFYCDTAKADGTTRSFKFAHIDGHTYVVRFAIELERDYPPNQPGRRAFPNVLLRVLGKV
jgi:hypothetical protein